WSTPTASRSAWWRFRWRCGRRDPPAGRYPGDYPRRGREGRPSSPLIGGPARHGFTRPNQDRGGHRLSYTCAMLARMGRGVMLGLVIALLAPAAGVRAQGEPAALTEATVVEREGAVEVWVRLTRPARYQAEMIDSPHRLVLDFDDTAYRWATKPVPA